MKKILYIIPIVSFLSVTLLCFFALKTPLFKHSSGDVLQTFEDGSQIISCGGDEYEHILFDDVKIRWYSSFVMRTVFSENDTSENNCYIDQYAFDSNGFVAICEFVFADDIENATETTRLHASEKYIELKLYYIFDVNEQTKTFFDSLEELSLYCSENNINLSNWYICSPFGSEQK